MPVLQREAAAERARAAAMRARWLRALSLVAGFALAVHACGRAEAPPGESAYSVQLHLHGSFSEGMGSVDSHSFEASDVGCDVLWWSDHDFRITTFEHVTRFGFEDWTEPLDRGEPWRLSLADQLGETKGMLVPARPRGSAAELASSPVREGERSLRLSYAPGSKDFEAFMLAFTAARMLERRSLALGVALELAVFPAALGPDARGIVQVRLSEHAPREGLAQTQYLLRYVLTDEAFEPFREGDTFHVPVRCESGRWNELALDVTGDAERGFPFAPGDDDVLYRVALGVEARGAARAELWLDDLRIVQEVSGPAGLERQRAVLADVARAYPEVEQLQGVEVSYGSRHLNLFCAGAPPLPDYEQIARSVARDPENPALLDERAFARAVIDDVVARTHERGGLVSYNHLFGVNLEGSPKARGSAEQLEILLRDRAAGADILEVGYRDRGGASLADHLWVWDRAGLAGLRLVGTGVSDSHGGPDQRWRGRPNNFVSWILAPSPRAEDLVEGLRGGRVFFGDIERFDGTLDLVTDRGHRMGRTVVTDRDEVVVAVEIRDLAEDARIAVIESGATARELPAPAGAFSAEHALRLPATGPALVRVEARDARGQAFLIGNPIHFLREVPAEGLPAATAAADVGGLHTTRMRGVRLLGWTSERTPEGALRARIRLEGSDGELELAGFDAQPAVAFEAGLSGGKSWSGEKLRLTALRGTGEIRVDR